MSTLQRGQSNFGLIIQHLLLPAFLLVRPTQNLTWVTISVTPYTVAFHDGSPEITGLGVTCQGRVAQAGGASSIQKIASLSPLSPLISVALVAKVALVA